MSWQLFLSPGRGREAEKHALHYLKKRGLKLLRRNYACRLGEIDLIMKDDNHIVFVEVRLRKQKNCHGRAEETINNHKRRKIIATAQHYIQKENNKAETGYRFDVVAMTDDNTKKFAVKWIKNAFIC